MSATWIVTANLTGARIIEKRKGALSLIEAISEPAGAPPASARGSSRSDAEMRADGLEEYTTLPQASERTRTTAALVREVAQSLRNQRALQRFDCLVLVAEPRLLAQLRDALDPTTSQLVARWMAKDVQDLNLSELGAELPPS